MIFLTTKLFDPILAVSELRHDPIHRCDETRVITIRVENWMPGDSKNGWIGVYKVAESGHFQVVMTI